jgi:hypothetical protein
MVSSHPHEVKEESMITDLAGPLKHLADSLTFEGVDDMETPGKVVVQAPYDSLTFSMLVQALYYMADFLERGSDHYVTITEDGWAIQHSLDCREENGDDLTECELHRNLSDPHDPFHNKKETPGRYKVIWHWNEILEGETGLWSTNWTLERVEP